MQSVTTKTEKETIAFAKRFFKKTLEGAEKDKPLIFCLIGELGAGKTQFVKGIGKALGVSGITSPTFVLMKKFVVGEKLPAKTGKGKPFDWAQGKQFFFHIDCYRIYDAEDARMIGMDKIIQSPRVIVAIEWAERIMDIVPRPYWEVRFEHVDENKRKITIVYSV